MIQVNLLPWREQARQAKQVFFGLLLIGFFILSLIAILFVHLYFSTVISSQKKNNAYLQSEITNSATSFASLKTEKEKQIKLLEQLHFIINLRTRSYEAVRLLTMLVNATPSTVFLDKILREDNVITLGGKAKSNLEITLFMKNIGKVNGFAQPVLTGISTQDSAVVGERSFQLKVIQEK
jgi:type IV pilus assembly protein PilN